MVPLRRSAVMRPSSLPFEAWSNRAFQFQRFAAMVPMRHRAPARHGGQRLVERPAAEMVAWSAGARRPRLHPRQSSQPRPRTPSGQRRRQKMDPRQPRRHNNQPQLQAGTVFSRNRRLRPPTPPRGTPLDDCVQWLGNSWMILFLFETPTGFGLFNYPGVKLFLPNAIEEIWADFGKETSLLRNLVILKDFQTFDRTSRAIDIHTGVCSKLADMIKNCLKPKQTLAVGNSDYKKVIEAKMRIYCLCNDAVMEVMWGLNNVLTTILPNEISSVTTGNYPKICQGMQMVLDCYGIHLEPELVNKRITEMVWSIHQFDSAVNKYHHILHLWGQTILEVSQIDTRQWDFLKLATTLMLLSYPKQVKNLSLGDSPEMLTQDEAKKFIEDAPEYHGKLNKDTCRIMYKDIAKARSLRARALRLLGALINEARKVNMKLDCSEV